MRKTRKAIFSVILAIVCCITSISPIQTSASEATEKIIDFSVETDDALFSSTYGDWSISEGAYKANLAWANAYLAEALSLETDMEISFDFCLQNDGDTSHQFNVGLVDISGGVISGGATAHFYYNSSLSMELGTLNDNFHNCTQGTWYADTTTNYFDGQTHKMTISITGKTVSYKIDDSDVFASVEIGLDSVYLIFQATSTAYWIDNIKIINSGTEEPVVPEYGEMEMDFESTEDGNIFTTNYLGWTVSDGVYKANSAWANTYTQFMIPTDGTKEISFDFCLQDDDDSNHQFNVGLTNISGNTFVGGVSAHFYYSNTNLIEMGSLNSEFGSTTGGTWYADTTTNYFDGNTHTMTITIADGYASYKIDGNDVFISDSFTSAQIGLDSVYLVFQATSTEYTIDNLKFHNIEEEVVVKDNGIKVDFSEETDSNIFGSIYGSWSVMNGIYHADSDWSSTYLSYLIPLDTNNQISFEFCLQDDNDEDHQFNVGLGDVSQDTVNGGVTAHFRYSSDDSMEMITLNDNFYAIGNGTWYADDTTDYFDGKPHTMTITVSDKNISYKIDGNEVLTSVAVSLDSAYLIFQATSTEYTVDNIVIKDVPAKVAGYSIALEESIALKYYLSMSPTALENNYDNVKMQFTLDDSVQTVAYADAEQIEDGYAAFTCDVPVKEMTELITAEIYNGDTKLGSLKYTVKDYTDAILADTITYEKEIPLVQAMLNYGSYAQKYFGYRTHDLANEEVHLGSTSLEDVDVSLFEPYKSSEKLGDDNVKVYGASLVLESKTTLRLYFTGSQADTATYNGEKLTQKGNYYYLDIKNILPQELTKDYTVTLNYGDNQSVEIEYNCMTYCYRALNSNSELLKDLVRALYLYHQAAIAYEEGSASAFENISVPYQECNAEFTVYVSPDGNDENSGTTLETAVCTVQQAQTLVQEYLNDGGTADCQILIDDGEYFLPNTLELTNQDVAGGNQLYIRAINANQATLTGSKQVSADTIVEVNDETLGRVWKIPCTENINQLYIDNSYATRARFPDAGEELRLLNWDKTLMNIIIDSNDVNGFELTDFKGSTLVANIMWAESYLRVRDIKNNGTTSAVNLVAADLSVFTRSTPQIKARQSYHFENSKAFLSTYGEWYYSAEESVVYYIPYEHETLNNTIVRIPYTDELLMIKGTADAPVEGIFVEGLNFKWTDNRYIDGKLGNQANKDDGSNKRFAGTVNDGRPISAISLEYAKNVTFSGNVFACMGGGAVDLVEGVQDSVVEKNVFHAIGGNGVFAGAISYYVDLVSTDESTFIKNVNIENNYFNDIAWQEYSGCAVILNYAVNSRISHNTINNTKYSGISVGWGWKKTELPFLQNNEISYNKVTNAVSLMSDGAAIYMVGCQPNSVIKNNYIDHIYNSVYKFPNDMYDSKDETLVKWSTAGIYLDQGVGGITETDKVQVVDNVVVESNVDIQQYITHNAKAGYYDLVEPEVDEENAIMESAGIQEDGFTLLPQTAILYGTHTESAQQVSVYGDNLGSSSEMMLVLKGKDGNFTQLSAEDIVSWIDETITFKTSNYLSGEIYLLDQNGLSSNSVVATCNVDENYCMYERFVNEWGGLEGLDNLLSEKLQISSTGFTCSTEISSYPASAIADGSTSTGWSCDTGDTNPWVAFSLDEASTVGKILIYARAGMDQEECRKNFNIYGIDGNGNECLIYTVDNSSPAFEADGILVVDVGETTYKDTVFQSFKITRPEGDATYFFVAEVAVVQ